MIDLKSTLFSRHLYLYLPRTIHVTIIPSMFIFGLLTCNSICYINLLKGDEIFVEGQNQDEHNELMNLMIIIYSTKLTSVYSM